VDSTIRLYSYWRSSASYRVRIALNLKQLKHEVVPVNLVKEGGEHHLADFHQLNPQERVPVLIDGGRVIRQSLAIIEYLEEVYDGNHLLPGTARERARARGLAHLIATDISPLGNLSVLQYLEQEDGMPQIERERWVRTWIERGFAAFEDMGRADLTILGKHGMQISISGRPGQISNIDVLRQDSNSKEKKVKRKTLFLLETATGRIAK